VSGSIGTGDVVNRVLWQAQVLCHKSRFRFWTASEIATCMTCDMRARDG
jgi:hypothetical protein